MTDQEKDRARQKDDVEVVLAEFDGKKAIFGELCARTRTLIEACLQDAGIRYQSLQYRVKEREKTKQKYLDTTKNYRQLDDITDLAGLRVVTYYEDEVDRVAEVIRKEFDIDPRKSVDKRETEPDKFGYNALNLVGKHLGKRESDVEYKKFANICFEIQVTSILRHAWSEIEHEWYDLKEGYPKPVRRRFYRLAALLEIAETEFRDIRTSRMQYVQSVAVQVGAQVLDLPVNAVSMRSFIEQEPLVGEIDQLIAQARGIIVAKDLPELVVVRRAKAARLSGMARLQELRASLAKHGAALPEFAARCGRELKVPRPAHLPLPKGNCIHSLTMYLACLRGVESATQFMATMGFLAHTNVAGQVAIAREVAAAH